MGTKDKLSTVEQDAYNKFESTHFANCLSTITVTYGNGGGIGTNIYVTCNRCKEKKDITDYGSW